MDLIDCVDSSLRPLQCSMQRKAPAGHLTLLGSACAGWACGGAEGAGEWCCVWWKACGWPGRGEGAGPFGERVEAAAPQRTAWNHRRPVTEEDLDHREGNRPPETRDKTRDGGFLSAWLVHGQSFRAWIYLLINLLIYYFLQITVTKGIHPRIFILHTVS